MENNRSAELVLTIGLPGSGKTTWAKAQVAADTTGRTVRINRDDIRFMTFGKYVLDNPREQEPVISRIQNGAVSGALMAGMRVIVDDTNLHERFRKSFKDLAARYHATYTTEVMETGVEECIARDLKRSETENRLVGRAVIERMAGSLR